MARDTQLTCECGSTFFYTVRAEQWAAGGYGTAEFRSQSNAPKTLLVCLCGKPVIPQRSHYSKGTSAGIVEEEFRRSTEVAQKAREAASPKHFAQIAASPKEVEEIKIGLEEVRRAFDSLSKPKAKATKAVEVKAS